MTELIKERIAILHLGICPNMCYRPVKACIRCLIKSNSTTQVPWPASTSFGTTEPVTHAFMEARISDTLHYMAIRANPIVNTS